MSLTHSCFQTHSSLDMEKMKALYLRNLWKFPFSFNNLFKAFKNFWKNKYKLMSDAG